MFKILSYIIIISIYATSASLSNSNVFIYATINKEIITNYDIKNEISYLQLLNPNLAQLNNEDKIKIAKNSLINEMIKKEEIKKMFDLDKDNPFVNDYLKDLFQKLNINNEKDLETILKEKEIYTLTDIKEKLKIEILWNELIYVKYFNQVRINKENLIKRIDSLTKDIRKEYFLSEILFEKKINEDLKTLTNKINSSILEIGFSNTANIYSISETSKYGGKVGWIEEGNLSDLIFQSLKELSIGDHTEVIKVNNNFIILKVDEIRSKKIEIDKEDELKKMINFETNKQLNQFSKIYFNKSKINYTINEK
jgi:peptidyl-prolyl cis-trans isomerase SurA